MKYSIQQMFHKRRSFLQSLGTIFAADEYTFDVLGLMCTITLFLKHPLGTRGFPAVQTLEIYILQNRFMSSIIFRVYFSKLVVFLAKCYCFATYKSTCKLFKLTNLRTTKNLLHASILHKKHEKFLPSTS